jgi:hypothetical protein
MPPPQDTGFRPENVERLCHEILTQLAPDTSPVVEPGRPVPDRIVHGGDEC